MFKKKIKKHSTNNFNDLIKNLDKKEQNMLLRKLLENNNKFKSLHSVSKQGFKEIKKEAQNKFDKETSQQNLKNNNKTTFCKFLKEKKSIKSTKKKNSPFTKQNISKPLNFIISPDISYKNQVNFHFKKLKNSDNKIINKKNLQLKKENKINIEAFQLSKNVYSAKKNNIKAQIDKILQKIN
jgi:hypothetical protein